MTVRRFSWFVVLGLLTLLCGTGAWAVEEHAGHVHGSEEPAAKSDLGIQPVERADGVIDLNNKVCPVSGQDVSEKDFYEYSGVNYSMCCKMCARDFAKDPAKFALSDEVIHQAMGHTGHTH